MTSLIYEDKKKGFEYKTQLECEQWENALLQVIYMKKQQRWTAPKNNNNS